MKNKTQVSNFINRKTQLPALSAQDMKIVFAHSETDKPVTKVVMSIPYYYDLLSAQGVREWNASRAATIEQEDVTTIKNDALSQPGAFHFTIQPIDHFEPIDSKVREIEQFASIMQQDLDELDIPQLAEPPHVEPIFTELPHRTTRVRFDDEEVDEAAIKRQRKQFDKPKVSRHAISSTDRAREKVKIAERTLKTGFGDNKKRKKVRDDDKRRNVANEERGKVNWARINQLMQEDEF
ncbi:hypothetical protein TRFO_39872 [Tritrichomonas foetus]|uniref:Uncharacterized protein n=1 Tax=Tritrichomonas foetus TaxID=1144522 RepID=A0A1J4J953_9EUKA|nr:hypothetical protein TRFO_39872 [Tritrichomonas foetus]|eukprot:OHS93941.1 hypothetical protein TRFO_39872 [Tritrichomonas foetus]